MRNQASKRSSRARAKLVKEPLHQGIARPMIPLHQFSEPHLQLSPLLSSFHTSKPTRTGKVRYSLGAALLVATNTLREHTEKDIQLQGKAPYSQGGSDIYSFEDGARHPPVQTNKHTCRNRRYASRSQRPRYTAPVLQMIQYRNPANVNHKPQNGSKCCFSTRCL